MRVGALHSPIKLFNTPTLIHLAAGEGFEPSHTESESAVLPLHKPAVLLLNSYHYTKKLPLVKRIFKYFSKFLLAVCCAKGGKTAELWKDGVIAAPQIPG